MNGKVFGCENCRNGYFIKDETQTKPFCTICNAPLIKIAEDWEEFKCVACNYQIDVSTLIIHGNLSRIPEGILRCKYDNNLMKLL